MEDNFSSEANRKHRGNAPVSGKLRTHYRVARSLEPIFSGNKVSLCPAGRYALCDCGESGLKLIDLRDSAVVGVIKPEEETITCFCTLPVDEGAEIEDRSAFIIITASHNGLIRQWRVIVSEAESENIMKPMTAIITLQRMWKAQPATPAGRISTLATDDESHTLLASAASDGSCRIWDLSRKTCTHMLRGHTGVISFAKFHSNEKGQNSILTSAIGDGQLRLWNLNSGSNPSFQLLNGHSSVVTDAAWSENGKYLVTVGRDQLIVLWDGYTFEKIKSWPCFEQLEAAFIYPLKGKKLFKDTVCVVTVGSKGEVCLWDVINGKALGKSEAISGSKSHQQHMDVDEDEKLLPVGFLSAFSLGNSSTIVCSTTDHRLVFYDVVEDDLALSIKEGRHVPGDVGEVLDICSFRVDHNEANVNPLGLLAVATNSPMIRIYDTSNWSCTFLTGHRAAVTSIATVSPRNAAPLLISGSRDNDALVWRIVRNGETGLIKPELLAKAGGHTAAILAVAALPSSEFFVTGGVDLTIKLWPISRLDDDCTEKALSCLATVKAHDKDVNSLVLSPNGRFLASGSQDKTVKIWHIERDHAGIAALQLMGTLRGHKRGIWSVDFSPIDQILASSSADGTIKLWALSNLSCLRTFEGHEVAVLRCRFMNRGTQLISSGSDGVIKSWSIQTGDCVATIETGHDDRVWAVTPIDDGQWLATGSADDRLVVWSDFTREHLRECSERDNARALDAQRLDNLLAGRNFLDAFNLALLLNQPARLWRIVRELRILSIEIDKLDDNISERPSLSEIVAQLDNAALSQLLRITAAWNTNTRFAMEAQFMLRTIFHVKTMNDLICIVKNDMINPRNNGKQLLKDSIEALVSYTTRHFSRVDRLATQSSFVDFAWSQLKLSEDDNAPLSLPRN